MILKNKQQNKMALSIGAAEYTDSSYECPGYDTKQSNAETSVMV